MCIFLVNMVDLKIEWLYIILKMLFGVCNIGVFLKSNWKNIVKFLISWKIVEEFF